MEDIIMSNEDTSPDVKLTKKERKEAKKRAKKAQKELNKGNPKKKLSKKAVAGISIGAVALAGGITFFALRDSNNYYSIWSRILDNELGSFRFVVDVRTGEHGEEVKLSEEEKETKDEETKDKDEQEVKTVEWTDKDGVTDGIWTYPNYKLVIDGCATSVEPLTLTMDVNMVTENFNDRLTSITVLDDNVYIDVEQIQYWLSSSQDSYFIELSKLIPENSKYLIMPLKDVKLVSNYAEEGERDKGYESDLMNAYRRLKTTVLSCISMVEDNMGSKGLSKSGDVYSLSYKNNSFMGVVSGLISSRSSVYDGIVNAQNSNGLLNEDQLKQLVNEKDNFLASTDALSHFVATNDLSNANMEVKGNAREYKGGNGSTNIEATLQTTFTVNDTDYSITLQGLRNGSGKEIKQPKASASKVDQQIVYDTFTGMLDYMDIFNVDMKKQLDITPDNIKVSVLEDFVELVNSTEATSARLTPLSAQMFIDRYKDYEETASSTEEDIINAQLVSDFLSSVNNVTGGAKGRTEDTTQIDRFRTVEGSIGDVSVIAEFDDESSNNKLGVLNITLLNNSSEEQTINFKDFSLQTMLSSKYPVNDETTIRDYDNTFDLGSLSGDITVPAGGFAQSKGYVIMSNGLEYMDLFYGDEKLGDIIAR